RSMLFFLTMRPPPSSTLFPYTTLFRSGAGLPEVDVLEQVGERPPVRSADGERRGARRLDRGDRLRELRPRADALDTSVLEGRDRSEEHTSELQSLAYLVCRLLLEKKKK